MASVTVAAGQAVDMADVAMAPAIGGPSTGSVTKGFWGRFAQAYYDDWHPAPVVANAAPASAAPAYRGYPPPESNPPYPFAVWPIGGTPWIGYNNATQYPLTTALQNGPNGEWWKKANIQIYGWANAGMNLSSSTESVGGKYANAPAAYNQIPNSIQLDQLTLYVERVPDTIQKGTFRLGFPVDSVIWARITASPPPKVISAISFCTPSRMARWETSMATIR